MKIVSTPIQGVFMIETSLLRDERGTFYRAFCDRDLESLLQGKSIRQANISRTEAVGSIRGMHFQYPPHAEIKLIRCLKGRVWDVALDLRQGSGTFLKCYGTELSAENTQMMVIPPGCAHGFQVLASGSELLYLHTASYEPKSEGGVRYNDSRIKIAWPLKVTDISQRDTTHPLLSEDFRGIVL